jgi:hypothetical protein
LNKPFGWVPEGTEEVKLADWNAQRRAFWEDAKARHMYPELFPNGLLCDACGGKLFDTMQTMSESPIIYRVKCLNCGQRSERYA